MTDARFEWVNEDLSFAHIAEQIPQSDRFVINPRDPETAQLSPSSMPYGIFRTANLAMDAYIADLSNSNQYSPIHPFNWRKAPPLFTNMTKAIEAAANQERFR